MVANAARKMIDKKYCLGDDTKGWDCLTMLWTFFDAMSVELPREFQGISADTYAKVWTEGGGRTEFLGYLESLGEEVDVNYIICGDVVICEHDEWVAPGIYLGSGHMLSAFEKGVLVVPIRFFKGRILSARRLCHRP